MSNYLDTLSNAVSFLPPNAWEKTFRQCWGQTRLGSNRALYPLMHKILYFFRQLFKQGNSEQHVDDFHFESRVPDLNVKIIQANIVLRFAKPRSTEQLALMMIMKQPSAF